MKKLSATIMVVGLLIMAASPAQAIDVRQYGYSESLGRWVRETVGASGSSLVEIIADGDTIGSTDNALHTFDVFPQRAIIDEVTGQAANVSDSALHVKLVESITVKTESPNLSVDTNTSVTLAPGDTHTFNSSSVYEEYSITPVGGEVHYKEDSVADTGNDIVIGGSKVYNDKTRPSSVSIIASGDNAGDIIVYFRGVAK